jgi:hypothetical protein|eukprot:COSAG06_NODE_1601_length_8960_cov_10.596998_4_plen_69_part_00
MVIQPDEHIVTYCGGLVARYLKLAEAKLGKAAVLDLIRETIVSLGEWTREAEVMLATRRQLARAITGG